MDRKSEKSDMNLSKIIFYVSFVLLLGVAPAIAEKTTAQTEVALLSNYPLKINISSGCVSDGAIFKIINTGSKWPQTARLKLYFADDMKLIAERRIRLASQQQLSFIVGDEIKEGRPVAVWLDPQWYERPFAFDAKLNCKQ